MALGPDDRIVVEIVRRLVTEYEQSIDVPSLPLSKAIIQALGGDAEVFGHEVTVGYLRHVLQYDPEIVGWIVGQTLQVALAKRALEAYMKPDPNLLRLDEAERHVIVNALAYWLNDHDIDGADTPFIETAEGLVKDLG